MNDMIRKHWTSLLGVLFIVAAFITLFQYSITNGWINESIKIGIGIVAGIGFVAGGMALTQQYKRIIAGEIVIGMGVCILYTTMTFAGISFDLWSPMAVLLGMFAVTGGITWYAAHYESRMLLNVCLAGGLLAPILMRPEGDQVFTLFLYLLVLNATFFYFSLIKHWSELRIVAFSGTWVLYFVYFFHFDPSTEGIWSLPVRYLLAAFLFYLIGFFVISWLQNRCFDDLNLFFTFGNSFLFGCWAVSILAGDLHFGYTLGIIGLVHMAQGGTVRRYARRGNVYSLIHLLSGGLLLLIALSQIGSGLDIKSLLTVYLWIIIAIILAAYARVRPSWLTESLSVSVWGIIGLYWLCMTWFTPRGEWFGVFLPFLNWSAISWMLLSGMAFYYSTRRVMPLDKDTPAQSVVTVIYAIVGHLILGLLITTQIVRFFQIYYEDDTGKPLQLALSVAWGLYALLLFFWGAYARQLAFRWVGGALLVIVALKTIFFDLKGEETLYKVLVLLVLGGISFLITWVNGKGDSMALRTEERPPLPSSVIPPAVLTHIPGPSDSEKE